MTSSRSLVLVSTLLIGSSGCYYVGVDLPDLETEIQSAALTFSQTAAEVGQLQTMSASVEVNLLDEFGGGLGDLLTRAEIRELALIPSEGITNFDFVKQVQVRIDGDGLQPLTLSSDREGFEQDVQGRLVVPVAADVDATEYFKRPTRFRIELECVVPATAWGVRLDLNVDLYAETWQQLL